MHNNLALLCLKQNMTQMITEHRRVCEGKRTSFAKNIFISLNCLMNLVVNVLLKCVICFSISSRWYALLSFCTQIVRCAHLLKASATTVLCLVQHFFLVVYYNVQVTKRYGQWKTKRLWLAADVDIIQYVQAQVFYFVIHQDTKLIL